MADFLLSFFDPRDAIHGPNRAGWSTDLVWLHNVSDTLLWSACLAIPIVLIYFIRRRRDLPFPAIFWLLGAVILGCGLTHFLEVLTSSVPLYRLSAVVKVVTAAVCWSTILPLVRVTPKALAMRSPEELEQEIAERTRVEQALRQSETIFRHVAQAANDAIISADHQGQMISWSKGAERIFGYAEEEMLGKPLTLLMPPCYREAHEQGVARVRAAGESRLAGTTVELVGRRKDGSEFPLELSLGSCQTREGLFFSGIVRDITERKRAAAEVDRLHEELKQRVCELEAVNRELEAFSHSVSHDLRAPLRAMDGFSRILLQTHAASLPEEARHYLQVVRDNAQQMGHLIDDLLKFARLGRQPLNKQLVSLTVLVRQVLEAAAGEQVGRQLEIQVGELPPCQADPALLKLVLSNLLDNALKYTRPRSTARIEVGSRQAPDEAGAVVYFVRDNGVGFDMRYAPKLFGVFQRLHRAEEYEGTGVGLATVQRIIHRHGGRIWADAEVDRGAAFYFTLGNGANHD